MEKYTFFIKTAFAQKRKTLHNNFKNTEFDILEKYQEELNLDFKKVRAENISIENFIALFNLSQKLAIVSIVAIVAIIVKIIVMKINSVNIMQNFRKNLMQ